MKQNSLSAQRGSVTSIILLLIIIVIAGKLTLAIAPAQVGDYQLTKLLAAQLKEANANNETSTQYIERVNRQLNINAYYDTVAQDIFTFTNKKAGQLAIYKNYQETNNFFANVDIVNRFEGNIDGTSAE